MTANDRFSAFVTLSASQNSITAVAGVPASSVRCKINGVMYSVTYLWWTARSSGLTRKPSRSRTGSFEHRREIMAASRCVLPALECPIMPMVTGV